MHVADAVAKRALFAVTIDAIVLCIAKANAGVVAVAPAARVRQHGFAVKPGATAGPPSITVVLDEVTGPDVAVGHRPGIECCVNVLILT